MKIRDNGVKIKNRVWDVGWSNGGWLGDRLDLKEMVGELRTLISPNIRQPILGQTPCNKLIDLIGKICQNYLKMENSIVRSSNHTAKESALQNPKQGAHVLPKGGEEKTQVNPKM